MWLSIKEATKHYGYSSPKSLQRRLRQLRDEGKVSDIGDPPEGYGADEDAPIKVRWLHPKAMMIADDAPSDLLSPARGRRT